MNTSWPVLIIEDYVSINITAPLNNFETVMVDPVDPSVIYIVSKIVYNLTKEDKENYLTTVYTIPNLEESNEEPIEPTVIGKLNCPHNIT